MKTVPIVALLLPLFFARPAAADLFTINPNRFAIGTDLSRMFDGVTLARLVDDSTIPGFNPMATPVLVSEAQSTHNYDAYTIGASYQNIAFHDNCLRSLSCGEFEPLELRFDAPTNYVSIASIGLSDQPTFYAYDVFGNRLGGYGDVTLDANWQSDSGLYYATFVNTLSMDQPLISRVVFGGEFGNVKATEVQYAVPEPATLLLVGLGALGLMRRRQRDRSAR